MKYLGFFLLGFLLVGCTPGTYKELKQAPASKYDFYTDQNYQAVYRTVLTKMRECHQAGMITAQMTVQGQLYTDIQEGEIIASLQSGMGSDVFLGVDVKKADSGTRVSVFSGINTWNGAARAVQKWVESEYQECKG